MLLYAAGENVKTVQTEVAEILQGRTLVGHAIHNDLKVHYYDVTCIVHHSNENLTIVNIYIYFPC